MVKHLSGRVKKFWAGIALLSAEILIILIVFILAFIAFVYLIRKIIIQNRTSFDENVFQYLRNHVSDRNNEIMQFITIFGSHDFLIPANLSLIAYFLFIRKHKWYSITVPAIALSSLGLMFGLKHLFNRARPDIPLLKEASGLSFPSGHALFSITFFGLLIYIIYKTIKTKALKWSLIVLLMLFIFSIGFTRIYLRVHYATDVIAGFSVGFMWLVFSIWMLNKMETFSKRKIDNSTSTAPAEAM